MKIASVLDHLLKRADLAGILKAEDVSCPEIQVDHSTSDEQGTVTVTECMQ
jgi:hypothetical protein